MNLGHGDNSPPGTLRSSPNLLMDYPLVRAILLTEHSSNTPRYCGGLRLTVRGSKRLERGEKPRHFSEVARINHLGTVCNCV